jgi:hypothetical protein
MRLGWFALAALLISPLSSAAQEFRLIGLPQTMSARAAQTSSRAGISSMVIEDRRIVITVPIEVVGGSDAMVEKWKQGIEATWNRGNDGRAFSVCGRRVEFMAHFTRRPIDGLVPRSVHVVVVEDVAPGEPYVSRVWHALGTSPAYSSRTGFWGSATDASTAAHEFGHLLGLLDEYEERDTNANGLREPGETPVPDERSYPDAWLSLMAHERGNVLERHVREVVRMHSLGDDVSCHSAR